MTQKIFDATFGKASSQVYQNVQAPLVKANLVQPSTKYQFFTTEELPELKATLDEKTSVDGSTTLWQARGLEDPALKINAVTTTVAARYNNGEDETKHWWNTIKDAKESPLAYVAGLPLFNYRSRLGAATVTSYGGLADGTRGHYSVISGAGGVEHVPTYLYGHGGVIVNDLHMQDISWEVSPTYYTYDGIRFSGEKDPNDTSKRLTGLQGQALSPKTKSPRWIRRASVQEVVHEKYGTRKFIIATDIFSRFYVYPVDVLTPEGKYVEVTIDPKTGEKTETEHTGKKYEDGFETHLPSNKFALTDGYYLTWDLPWGGIGEEPKISNMHRMFSFDIDEKPYSLAYGTPVTYWKNKDDFKGVYADTDYDNWRGLEGSYDPVNSVLPQYYLWRFNHNATRAASIIYEKLGGENPKKLTFPNYIGERSSMCRPTNFLSGYMIHGDAFATMGETFSGIPAIEKPYKTDYVYELSPVLLEVILDIELTGFTDFDFTIDFKINRSLKCEETKAYYTTVGYSNPTFDKNNKLNGGNLLSTANLECYGKSELDINKEQPQDTIFSKPVSTDDIKEELPESFTSVPENLEFAKMLISGEYKLKTIQDFLKKIPGYTAFCKQRIYGSYLPMKPKDYYADKDTGQYEYNYLTYRHFSNNLCSRLITEIVDVISEPLLKPYIVKSGSFTFTLPSTIPFDYQALLKRYSVDSSTVPKAPEYLDVFSYFIQRYTHQVNNVAISAINLKDPEAALGSVGYMIAGPLQPAGATPPPENPNASSNGSEIIRALNDALFFNYGGLAPPGTIGSVYSNVYGGESIMRQKIAFGQNNNQAYNMGYDLWLLPGNLSFAILNDMFLISNLSYGNRSYPAFRSIFLEYLRYNTPLLDLYQNATKDLLTLLCWGFANDVLDQMTKLEYDPITNPYKNYVLGVIAQSLLGVKDKSLAVDTMASDVSTFLDKQPKLHIQIIEGILRSNLITSSKMYAPDEANPPFETDGKTKVPFRDRGTAKVREEGAPLLRTIESIYSSTKSFSKLIKNSEIRLVFYTYPDKPSESPTKVESYSLAKFNKVGFSYSLGLLGNFPTKYKLDKNLPLRSLSYTYTNKYLIQFPYLVPFENRTYGLLNEALTDKKATAYLTNVIKPSLYTGMNADSYKFNVGAIDLRFRTLLLHGVSANQHYPEAYDIGTALYHNGESLIKTGCFIDINPLITDKSPSPVEAKLDLPFNRILYDAIWSTLAIDSIPIPTPLEVTNSMRLTDFTNRLQAFELNRSSLTGVPKITFGYAIEQTHNYEMAKQAGLFNYSSEGAFNISPLHRSIIQTHPNGSMSAYSIPPLDVLTLINKDAGYFSREPVFEFVAKSTFFKWRSGYVIDYIRSKNHKYVGRDLSEGDQAKIAASKGLITSKRTEILAKINLIKQLTTEIEGLQAAYDALEADPNTTPEALKKAWEDLTEKQDEKYEEERALLDLLSAEQELEVSYDLLVGDPDENNPSFFEPVEFLTQTHKGLFNKAFFDSTLTKDTNLDSTETDKIDTAENTIVDLETAYNAFLKAYFKHRVLKGREDLLKDLVKQLDNRYVMFFGLGDGGDWLMYNDYSCFYDQPEPHRYTTSTYISHFNSVKTAVITNTIEPKQTSYTATKAAAKASLTALDALYDAIDTAVVTLLDSKDDLYGAQNDLRTAKAELLYVSKKVKAYTAKVKFLKIELEKLETLSDPQRRTESQKDAITQMSKEIAIAEDDLKTATAEVTKAETKVTACIAALDSMLALVKTNKQLVTTAGKELSTGLTKHTSDAMKFLDDFLTLLQLPRTKWFKDELAVLKGEVTELTAQVTKAQEEVSKTEATYKEELKKYKENLETAKKSCKGRTYLYYTTHDKDGYGGGFCTAGSWYTYTLPSYHPERAKNYTSS